MLVFAGFEITLPSGCTLTRWILFIFVRFGLMFGWLPAEPFIGRPSSRSLSTAALAATHWRWTRPQAGLGKGREREREKKRHGRNDPNITVFLSLPLGGEMSLRILLLKKSWPETKGAQRNRGNAGPPLISWVKEASGGFILAQIYEIFHQKSWWRGQ